MDPGQVTGNMVPYRLYLDYYLDFRTRRVDDIAPTLSSPLLLASLATSFNLRGQRCLGSMHPSRQMVTCGRW